MKKTIVIGGLCGCALGAWWFQRGESLHARSLSHAAAPSPAAEMIVAGLGGFRGIVSEVIWFRADRLQEDGRYAELAQLATWLTYLEPHTPEVWAYMSWNLAYNVAVMMPTPADRWRWVEAGLRLLRDDGLAFNPGNPELYRELAWLFLLKLGSGIDSATDYYKAEWKRQIDAARAANDWSGLKLDPERMAETEKAYGSLDWADPYASALYWGREGLLAATRPEHRRELRQIIYQTLMMVTRREPRFARTALRELQEAYQEWPHPGLKEVIEKFRQQHNL